MKKAPKVVIIGLDAATQHLLEPWVKEGKLPHLATLIQEGTGGLLESVIQPLTPAAWTTFMTGKNPGKHGIYNYTDPTPEGYGMIYTNGGSRKCESIWKMLNRAGLSVGVMNTPFTFPPEKVDGFQISGCDTPSSDSAFVHPAGLKAEVEKTFGKLRLDANYLGAMTSLKKRAEALETLKACDEQWSQLALYLLEQHPQDVMMFTFMSIDTVQHHFWHYMDNAHYYHDREGAKLFKDAILQVYQRLDRTVGQILERLDLAQTSVFCVSDHGQEAVSDRTIYVNRILSQAGLLAYKSINPWQSLFVSLGRSTFSFLRKTLSSGQKKLLANVFPRLRENAEGMATSYSEIDWSKTMAYCNESPTSSACVMINLKGLKPDGIVEKAQYEAVIKKACEAFYAVKDPRNGKSVIGRVYRRDELYSGPHAYSAPDLTLQWWGDSPFNTRPSLRGEENLPALTIEEARPLVLPEWSGHHTIDGIIIARGPCIKQNVKCMGARLIDMAPTILYLLNLPIPDDMDGKVLFQLFDRPTREESVRYESNPVEINLGTDDFVYSEEEAVLVEERLKNLGYLE